jgi:hypothetical protein
MSEYRHALVGTRLPEGAYTIDPDEHRVFCEAVFHPGWTSELAHPLFLHLVAHCGKGMELDAFFRLIGTALEAGVTFGQGQLDYHQPLRVGASYRVLTDIRDVQTKRGRKRGAFDVVTCHSRVFDETDAMVGESHESYVVPSQEAA